MGWQLSESGVIHPVDRFRFAGYTITNGHPDALQVGAACYWTVEATADHEAGLNSNRRKEPVFEGPADTWII
jgi:hypothetical protein